MTRRPLRERTGVWLLTTGGLGFLKPGPGTWGSIPPVLFALLLVWIWLPGWMIDLTLILIGLFFSIACIRFGRLAEQTFGRKDPSEVVADETAGVVLPLLFLPWVFPLGTDSLAWNISLALTAFATFRFFDITKIPPAHQLQSLRAGWGVLVDDLVAGVYALIVTQLLVRALYPALPFFS